MTYIVAKLGSFFGKKTAKDPVYKFFYEASAKDKKRVYSSALRKAQVDQEKVMEKVGK